MPALRNVTVASAGVPENHFIDRQSLGTLQIVQLQTLKLIGKLKACGE
jgi:hypothetical protein